MIALGLAGVGLAIVGLGAVLVWFAYVDHQTAELPIPTTGGFRTLQPLEPPPPPPSGAYKGDLALVSRSSKILPQLQPFNQRDFLVLANAEVFVVGTYGMSDEPAAPTIALNNLRLDPRAPEAFGELAQSPSPTVRLYGLCGLYLVDEDVFRALLPAFKADDAEVFTYEGCTGRTLPVRELVTAPRPCNQHAPPYCEPDIESGAIPREFTRWSPAGSQQPYSRIELSVR